MLLSLHYPLFLLDMYQGGLLEDNTTPFQATIPQTRISNHFMELHNTKTFWSAKPQTPKYWRQAWAIKLKYSPLVSILAQHPWLIHTILFRNQLPIWPRPWRNSSISETNSWIPNACPTRNLDLPEPNCCLSRSKESFLDSVVKHDTLGFLPLSYHQGLYTLSTPTRLRNTQLIPPKTKKLAQI